LAPHLPAEARGGPRHLPGAAGSEAAAGAGRRAHQPLHARALRRIAAHAAGPRDARRRDLRARLLSGAPPRPRARRAGLPRALARVRRVTRAALEVVPAAVLGLGLRAPARRRVPPLRLAARGWVASGGQG